MRTWHCADANCEVWLLLYLHLLQTEDVKSNENGTDLGSVHSDCVFNLGTASSSGANRLDRWRELAREDSASRNGGAPRGADWGFAKEMHPEALKSFKTAILDVMDSAEKAGREGELLSLFKDVTAVSDLRNLNDAAFFASFYEGVIKMQPRIRDSMKGMTIEVIGNVKEGTDVLHVVYRGTVNSGDLKVSQLSVMSMKANGDRWGMLLTSDLEVLAATLKKQF